MNTIRIAAINMIALVALAACAPTPTPTSVPPTAAPTATRIPPTATTAPTTIPPTATSAPAAAAAASITLNFGPGRDGDQSPGTAVLTAQGSKTEVVLNIKPGPAGVAQSVHIHEGTCPGVGAVKFRLTDIADGKSTTVVDVALAGLLTGGFAINAHKGNAAPDVGVYVACSNIPKGVISALGPGRDADQSPGTAVLVSAGTKTDVYINIKPGAAGVGQAVMIHEGSCPGVGGVKFPLTALVDGKSKTTVDASLDDLLKGTYAINAHKGTAAPDVGLYVACGAVK